jgi:hypothetical protein
MSFMPPSDMITSAVLGVVLSFGILYFSPQIFKPADFTNNSNQSSSLTSTQSSLQPESSTEEMETKQTKKLGSILGVTNKELTKLLKEEHVVRNSRKLQKVLGMTEIDVRNAIRQDEDQRSAVEEAVVMKTRKLQKVLGMNEHEVREAVRSLPYYSVPQAIDDDNKRSDNDNDIKEGDFIRENQPVNWIKVLDGFVYLILFAIFCYFFNYSTNGDFGRVMCGLFPREFSALGLKSYLERLSADDPRYLEGMIQNQARNAIGTM